MMTRPIYLDAMATTPCDPKVIEVMQRFLGASADFGNASSVSHGYGQAARAAIEQAREQLAMLIQADPKSIIWTSGATESNNLAIAGAAHFHQRQGKHIVTMSSEHIAVLDPCGVLSAQGYQVTYLDPLPNGQLDLVKLKDALRDDTVLVSVMHVNNETGATQDILRIGRLLRDRGILFHVDAAQSLGKLPIDCRELPVDLMSFSGHKIYGPKGVGALYVRPKPKLRLKPILVGGGQEQGLRSGTLPTHQIAGMGMACEIARYRLTQDYQHCVRLSALLMEQLQTLPNVTLNGNSRHRYPGCFSLQFAGIDGDTLLRSLPSLALSRGSACNAVGSRPSHVLLSYGLSPQQANQTLRLSVGRQTLAEDVEQAATAIIRAVCYLRSISPVWDEVASN